MQQCNHYGGIRYFIICGLLTLFLFGCSSNTGQNNSDKTEQSGELRSPTAQVLLPEASGTTTYEFDSTSLDSSHISDGYIMLKYTGDNKLMKLQMTTPDGIDYTYPVSIGDDYSTYPLSGGNGTYKVTLLESVDTENNLYAVVFTQDLDVALANEFSPFLYPNYYIYFTQDSAVVKKGEELASDCYCDLDVVSNIYNFVIETISYDDEKAATVQSGYTPNPDQTLSDKTGICFDYASLMSAMLRSQNIPTKLEVGYSGDAYHAWISCYVDEIGWVDDIIEFNGKEWSLMDPTLAANNSRSSIKEYIGDGSNYITKYIY